MLPCPCFPSATQTANSPDAVQRSPSYEDKEAIAKPKPFESNYDTLFRWYRVCRILEQAHTEKSISYDRWNSYGSWFILSLAFLSGAVAAIPARHECGDGVYDDGVIPEGLKAALIECCAAFTIMATGIRQQLKYESKCEAHQAAARGYKGLLIRFEDLVQRGIHYMVPGEGGGRVELQQSPRRPLSPGTPAVEREVLERELEPRRTPSWKDWHDDFLRVMKMAPFITSKEWNKARGKADKGVAVTNMEKMLYKLAGEEAPAPAPAPSPRPAVPGQPRSQRPRLSPAADPPIR